MAASPRVSSSTIAAAGVSDDANTQIKGGPMEEPAVQQQLLHGVNDSSRPLPMRVLVLGMPGTSNSMRDVLRQIGITKVYDTKLLLSPSSTKDHDQLLKMQRGENRKRRHIYFTAADFDPILQDHEAVVDWPAAAYATDLMIAYRGTKIILTDLSLDDKQEWKRQLQSAVDALHTSRLTKLLLKTNLGNFRKTYQLLKVILQGFFDGDIQQHAFMSYNIHEGRIKGTLNLQKRDEARDVLKYDPFNDGWGPLCQFLNVQVPSTPSPTAATRDSAKDLFRDLAPWRLFVRYANHRWYLSGLAALPLTITCHLLIPLNYFVNGIVTLYLGWYLEPYFAGKITCPTIAIFITLFTLPLSTQLLGPIQWKSVTEGGLNEMSYALYWFCFSYAIDYVFMALVQ